MCVELYFLINQAADFSIIAAVSRSMGFFRFRRTMAAATLAALYATLALAVPALAAPWLQLALLPPLAMLATGRCAPDSAVPAGISLMLVALSTGALAARLLGARFTPAALLLPALLSLGTAPRRRLTADAASLEVRCRGSSARFHACVDTGNRLIEPLSGQPVMIVSERLLRGLLPERGYRRVAYGSVGGGGELRCFRPDGIYIWEGDRRRRAPDAWIAVFPDRLPGRFQALTPAAFAFA